MSMRPQLQFHQWGRRDEIVAAIREELLTSKGVKEIYSELMERFQVSHHCIHRYVTILYDSIGNGGRLKLMAMEIAKLQSENIVLKGTKNGRPRILSRGIHSIEQRDL